MDAVLAGRDVPARLAPVEVGAEVPKARVDDQGNYSRVGSEPLGNPQCGNDVRPGRGACKDAFLAGKSPAHRHRLLSSDLLDRVNLVRFPERWDQANPDSLDPMRAGWLSRKDGRLSWLDGDDLKRRVMRAKGARIDRKSTRLNSS